MKKILVIEDETAINDLICMNLEIAGYQPVPFFDGNEFSRHLKGQILAGRLCAGIAGYYASWQGRV